MLGLVRCRSRAYVVMKVGKCDGQSHCPGWLMRSSAQRKGVLLVDKRRKGCWADKANPEQTSTSSRKRAGMYLSSFQYRGGKPSLWLEKWPWGDGRDNGRGALKRAL